MLVSENYKVYVRSLVVQSLAIMKTCSMVTLERLPLGQIPALWGSDVGRDQYFELLHQLLISLNADTKVWGPVTREPVAPAADKSAKADA